MLSYFAKKIIFDTLLKFDQTIKKLGPVSGRIWIL